MVQNLWGKKIIFFPQIITSITNDRDLDLLPPEDVEGEEGEELEVGGSVLRPTTPATGREWELEVGGLSSALDPCHAFKVDEPYQW